MMNGIDDDLDFPEEKSEDPELTTTTTTPEPLVKVETVPYTKPSIEGLQFAETFDDNIFNRWIKSANEKFSGEWSQALRSLEAIEGDKGLKVMNEARHHGIAAKMPEAMIKNKGKAVVVSYEAKFEEGLNCGGAYIKLFHTSNLTSKGSKMSEFDNETPYSVMFGPDHCGTTNKVHFIIKQFNPISKEWVEHHLADPPRVPQGKLTHVYSFIVKPNNTYEVLVDGAVSKSGDMNADFEPPFTPPKQIDDPTDSKPSDWVDEERIDDPDAVKPEDWDEDAPREIPDAKAVMPEGWLENEEQMIGDANTRQPEDWDTEEDGEWSAPLIKNPACISVPGCGKWKAPMIPNPDFKGKWYPPMIPNPAFKGIWTPKQIDNPNYFVSENPHALPDFNAIGFELWTMQKKSAIR